MNVTIWNEFIQERQDEPVIAVYPNGIHAVIADYFGGDTSVTVKTATLDQPEHGLTADVLENTDVLIWWGHRAHGEVSDEIVEKVYNRVMRGMGLIVLHSGHHAKIFKKLMGTTCNLSWRPEDRERIWCVEPNHPIAKGIPQQFELEKEEMYGERFDIPQPCEVIFLGWFAGGEVVRAGCTFNRGLGKIFYFQPGHEEYPVYYNENVKKIITNAAYWANPNSIIKAGDLGCPRLEPLEG